MKNFLAYKTILVTGLALFAGSLALFANAGEAANNRQAAQAVQPETAWPAVQLQQVAGGFDRPIYLTHAGDGSGRLFVVEQAGMIRILQDDGSIAPAAFLDIHERVQSPANGGGNEEGLLSVAFPSNYAEAGIFYVYYTNLEGNNQVSRFRTGAGSGLADPGSEQAIIFFEHPGQANHNGGQLAFGPEGYLYIGTGDGGGSGDPGENAQDTASLLGKVLRIDVTPITPPDYPNETYLPCIQKNSNNQEDGTNAYRIPPDNPFVGREGYRPEIWALGLRNPWRFSFDRQAGDLWIADVGQSQYEEVNLQPAASAGGENYGWNIMEGRHCFGSATCDQTGLTLPVTEYGHSLGCSITGGYVYRGSTAPALQGIYFYADFCSGRIWGLQEEDGWQSQVLLNSGYSVSSFGEDENGELYLADLYGGEIYQLTAATH
ncbi:MAG: PQQ-dependent sugar dehydrogenase [Chloroflexota bacterium]